MRRTVVTGLLLAAATGLLIFLSDPLNLHVEAVGLLGVAIGAVLAIHGTGAPWERLAAFAVGLVAAWLSYGMRAGFLPDSTGGQVVAVSGLIVLLVLVAWISASRLELWALLLGAATMAGAYEVVYKAAPPRFMDESPAALTGVLLAAAVGFAVVTLTTAWIGPDREGGRHRDASAAPDQSDGDDTHMSLDGMFDQTDGVRP